MPKISVIIPVYNVERYLKACLDSILAQTFSDIEVICVNDGSTDSSGDILTEYALNDSRVKIITQVNKGAGAARNAGLKIAGGEFLSFVDADDFLDTKMYEILYNKIKANNCDIAICDYYSADAYGNKLEECYKRLEYSVFQKYSSFNIETAPFEVLNRFATASWNKLFKAEFIKNNGFFFQEIKRANDLFFVKSTMMSAQAICCVSDKLIFYRKRPDSLQWSRHKSPDSIIKALLKLKSFMVKKGVYEKFADEYKYICREHCYGHAVSFNKSAKLFFTNIKFLRQLEKLGPTEFGLQKDIIRSYYIPNCVKKYFRIKNYKKAFNKYLSLLVPKKDLKVSANQSGVSITLIICVYNGEEYLDKCLRSVVLQTLQDIEVIIVNDGSTDNSLEILNEYAEFNDKIKIINQPNCGLATARNNALKLAKGDYVAFLDADDWLRADALGLLYSAASINNLDMLSYGGVNVEQENMQKVDSPYYSFRYLPENYFPKTFNYKKFRKYLLKMAVTSGLTMYKRKFIENNSINFPDGCFFEDNIFFTKSLFLANRCGILRETVYYRLLHPEQITANRTAYFDDCISIVGKIKDLMDELNIAKSIKVDFIVKYVWTCLSYYKKLPVEEKFKYSNRIADITKFYEEALDDKYYDFKDKIFSVRRINNIKQIYFLGLKLRKEQGEKYRLVNNFVPVS